jgi:CRISPR-associated protein Cas1
MRDALKFPMPISERISFLHFEKTFLERDSHGLVTVSGVQRVQIPIGRTSVIMLGPGSTISHAAISLCALEGALVIWVGEAGVRMYSAGNPRSNGHSLLVQAQLRSDERSRLTVARKIYTKMFDVEPPQNRSVDQLRGIEGAKVKMLYAQLAEQHKITWVRRNSSDMSDPVNAALSTASSALYGVTEAAVLTLGLSPALGFIHSGDPRSFVFDIADIIKFKTVVPLAFDVVANSTDDVEARTRAACRNLFYSEAILAKLVNLIDEVLCADATD